MAPNILGEEGIKSINVITTGPDGARYICKLKMHDGQQFTIIANNLMSLLFKIQQRLEELTQ